MVGEGIQNYVNLAAGLSKATREKAVAAAKGLLAQAGLEDVAENASERVTHLAEEVLAASRANRELMLRLVSTEVDRVAGQLGFARVEDLEELRRDIAELRIGLAHQSAQSARADRAADDASETAAPAAKKAPAKRAPTKKSPATKSASAPVKKTAAKKAPAQPAAAETAPPAKKAPAKKSPAKKAPARKTAATVVADA